MSITVASPFIVGIFVRILTCEGLSDVAKVVLTLPSDRLFSSSVFNLATIVKSFTRDIFFIVSVVEVNVIMCVVSFSESPFSCASIANSCTPCSQVHQEIMKY